MKQSIYFLQSCIISKQNHKKRNHYKQQQISFEFSLHIRYNRWCYCRFYYLLILLEKWYMLLRVWDDIYSKTETFERFLGHFLMKNIHYTWDLNKSKLPFHCAFTLNWNDRFTCKHFETICHERPTAPVCSKTQMCSPTHAPGEKIDTVSLLTCLRHIHYHRLGLNPISIFTSTQLT